MPRMRSFCCPVTTAERPGDYMGTSVARKVPYRHIIYEAVARHRIMKNLYSVHVITTDYVKSVEE